MIKSTPKQLAIDISERSNCRVKVGAVLVDRKGIFSWGWNHMGNLGYGCCAEIHAINRANPKRLKGSTIFVWWKHRKTNNPVPAKPCLFCQTTIYAYGIKTVFWNDKDRGWKEYSV